MAFYNQQEDEDQQDPNASGTGQQTQTGSQIITGGQGGLGASPQGAQANTPDKSGNFVGLSKYLSANKNQAQKLGSQVTGVIDQSADQARQGVGALNQEAQDKIKAPSMLDEDTSNTLMNGAENLTQAQKDAIKSNQSAKYQGPQTEMDLNAYQNASDKTKLAANNINNVGTEQGRMSLISQVNAKPRTQGENVFDNALVQAGGGREKLQQAATQNQDVTTGLDSAAQNIRGQIGTPDDPNTPDVDESTGAIGNTAKAKADASKRVQDALSAWTQGFQPKVAQAQQGLVDAENRADQDISDNPYGLSDETRGLFGLNNGDMLFNLNLNDYLNKPSVDGVNAANVATPEDYARYAALNDLSGGQGTVLSQANASQAGKAPSLFGDTTRLQQDMQKARTGYDKAYNTGNMDDKLSAFEPGNMNPTAQMAFQAAKGQPPAYIQSVLIPSLETPNPNMNASDRESAAIAADALRKSLNAWAQSAGANNIVNAPQALPTDDKGQIDWGQITAPKGK